MSTGDDVPEGVFAEPELDLLAKVIQVEFFHIRWREDQSIP